MRPWRMSGDLLVEKEAFPGGQAPLHFAEVT